MQDLQSSGLQVLPKVSLPVQPHLVSLQGALYLNNIASALEAHVREASVRGWALPQQLHPPTSDDNADVEEGQKAGEREGIDVKGMWPYWLEGRSASTVRNTLNLENMVILTGPPSILADPSVQCENQSFASHESQSFGNSVMGQS